MHFDDTQFRCLVGNLIYQIVENEVGESLAPKVTGMLIDLPR